MNWTPSGKLSPDLRADILIELFGWSNWLLRIVETVVELGEKRGDGDAKVEEQSCLIRYQLEQAAERDLELSTKLRDWRGGGGGAGGF